MYTLLVFQGIFRLGLIRPVHGDRGAGAARPVLWLRGTGLTEAAYRTELPVKHRGMFAYHVC